MTLVEFTEELGDMECAKWAYGEQHTSGKFGKPESRNGEETGDGCEIKRSSCQPESRLLMQHILLIWNSLGITRKSVISGISVIAEGPPQRNITIGSSLKHLNGHRRTLTFLISNVSAFFHSGVKKNVGGVVNPFLSDWLFQLLDFIVTIRLFSSLLHSSLEKSV